MEKSFVDINQFFKEKFSEKVYKLNLSLNLTCPNRDGKLSSRGCIFCSELGSGEFVASGSLREQIRAEMGRVRRKFPKARKFIAYFQNFSNTYGEVEYLKTSYEYLLEYNEIVAISIGTRADCFSEGIFKILYEVSQKKFLYVEIGLQTIHETSRKWLNIGYSMEVFESTVNHLHALNIPVVAHLILGIAGESVENMLQSVEYIIERKIWGVKFHHFFVAQNSTLATYYFEKPFELLSHEKYLEILIQCIHKVKEQCVIHRLSSDPDRKTLIAPIWSISKIEFLNELYRRVCVK